MAETETEKQPAQDKSALNEPQNNAQADVCCREGGYGWVCVMCTFLINAHTWGINSAYGVFLAYYLSNDVFSNMTALQYAFVGGLSISCAMLISPVVTYLSHHFSRRLVLNIGAVLVSVSLITTSFVKRNWQLFLSQGICFGFGMGFSFVGSVGIVSHWFETKRSLVNGITSAGSGTGGLIYSLAAGKMIPRLGFPWAMRALGIICFTVNLPCSNLLRLPPEYDARRANQPALRLSLLRRPEYLIYLLWGLLSTLGYTVLLFSMSSYAVAMGLTQWKASIAGALLNLGQAFGRPAVGLLSDKLGRLEVTFVATLLDGLFCLVIWVFANSIGVIYFFAILVGLVAGTLWAAAAPLGAEVVGLTDLPSALGIFWFVLVPPTAVAEPIALQLRNGLGHSKPYLRVQLFAGFVYLGAALCVIPLRILLSRRRAALLKWLL